MEPKPPKSLNLVLHLEPSAPQQPWRAVLLDPETQEERVFNSPLELLQYLEQLCRASGGQVFGIR
ncbi:hypothetical protein Mlute_01819 [Meiothermus luteus]|jgi:hypothetical protein|uniref:Uncharacterized protein n=2 Tax=Meiothermus luteus TaxID=2026184 RepID=A0A399EKX0_9DEIN|nr:hypothetical protein Mlute_01819 [Meiothermus luteus]RMH57697.1 MAG: hypothetical protein D6684_02720 [Deinococcota bacterium]